MHRKAETVPFPGGLRRRWPGSPVRLPSGRDPSLMREVMLRGGDRLVDAGRMFGSWIHLMALAESGWLGPPRASMRTAMAETGGRLCGLAAQARTLAELAVCSPGDVVFVTGVVAAPAGVTFADGLVWSFAEDKYCIEEFFAQEDPWPLPDEPVFIETAHNFLIADGASDSSALVEVDGAYLVGCSRLLPGMRVGVIGFADAVVDPTGVAGGPRQPLLRNVLRSGPSPPLLVLVT